MLQKLEDYITLQAFGFMSLTLFGVQKVVAQALGLVRLEFLWVGIGKSDIESLRSSRVTSCDHLVAYHFPRALLDRYCRSVKPVVYCCCTMNLGADAFDELMMMGV